MFGLGLGEIILLLIVGIVVVGPRNLPTLMRTLGQWVTKLRRMSTDLRSQSGIDDLIRQEGLQKEIAELKSLARVNVLDSLTNAATPPPPSAGLAPPRTVPTSARSWLSSAAAAAAGPAPLREREYPVVGCDAYGALPDDVAPHPPVASESTRGRSSGAS